MCDPIPAVLGLKLESVELFKPGPDQIPPFGENPESLNPMESIHRERFIPASTTVGSVTLMVTIFSDSQVLLFFQMNLTVKDPTVAGMKVPLGFIPKPDPLSSQRPKPGKSPPAFAICTMVPPVARQKEVSLAKTAGKGLTTMDLVSELSQPLAARNR